MLLGFSWLPVLHANLYSFVATYILGYDAYLTTGKILTGENGEGSNACTLPCGVGGFGRFVRCVGDEERGRLQGQRARMPYSTLCEEVSKRGKYNSERLR